MMYIVMIPNHWGRGRTPIAAANVARGIAGKRRTKAMPKPRIVYRYEPKRTSTAYIDEMGALCWKGAKPVKVEEVLK